MNPDDIRRFVAREREPVRRAKLEFWAEGALSGDSTRAIDAGHQLFEHARTILPDFPSNEYLADDLDHHIRLKRLLDRASQVLALRCSPR